MDQDYDATPILHKVDNNLNSKCFCWREIRHSAALRYFWPSAWLPELVINKLLTVVVISGFAPRSPGHFFFWLFFRLRIFVSNWSRKYALGLALIDHLLDGVDNASDWAI